jgi:hypothetical protein
VSPCRGSDTIRASFHLARRTALVRGSGIAILALALGAGPLAATQDATDTPTAPAEASDAAVGGIVVNAVRDIVVNGRARRCRPAPGDPLDAVRPGDGSDLRAIVPDGSGGYVSEPNGEQMTGPDFWQRVGIHMGEFDFRGPSPGRPMCIGGRAAPQGFAGFRRIVDATPYRGHRVRFTAWVATGRARQVSFWLAVGTEWRSKRPPSQDRKTPFNKLLNGGNTNNVPFGGDHDWTPVLLETGPLPADAHHISYGFNLQGSGDVWVYRPKLEIVDPAASTGTGDVILIGKAGG